MHTYIEVFRNFTVTSQSSSHLLPFHKMSCRSASLQLQQLQRAFEASIQLQSRQAAIAAGRRQYSGYTPVAREIKANNGFISQAQPQKQEVKQTGLERLPASSLTRNLMLGTMFTSPLLFKVGMAVLEKIANSESRLLNPDANPVLRALVKPVVYDQFCAGTNQKEIYKTRDEIRDMGYSGVILCYGREIQVSNGNEMKSTGKPISDMSQDIIWWRDGNLKTLNMVGGGDWLGMK